MKAFLVAVSSLCLCGILLCFMAYATGKFPSIPRVYDMPKLTQHTSVATMPQQVENYQDGIGMQSTTVETDPSYPLTRLQYVDKGFAEVTNQIAGIRKEIDKSN
jgi:hypothetical protein